MANEKDHVLGTLRSSVDALKNSGFTDVEVGPLTSSNSKRYVLLSDLAAAIASPAGMTVLLRLSGTTLEVVVDGDVVASLATTV